MSLDLTKYEEFGIALVQRIKATTATYRRKWNKLQAVPVPEPEPNPVGEAYVAFINEADLCSEADEALIPLIEAITGKPLVIPEEEKKESRFPDLPTFAAIVNLSDGDLSYVGVKLNTEGNNTHEIYITERKDDPRISTLDTYMGDKDTDEEVRVASSAEIDRWAATFLHPGLTNSSNAKKLVELYEAWFAFCQ